MILQIFQKLFVGHFHCQSSPGPEHHILVIVNNLINENDVFTWITTTMTTIKINLLMFKIDIFAVADDMKWNTIEHID